MRGFIVRRPLLSFFLLAYGFSWAYWVPLALSGRRVGPGSALTHAPGLLGPALAALIVIASCRGMAGIREMLGRAVQISRPSYLFWLYSLSPLGFLALALVAARLTGSPLPSAGDFALYSGLPALGLVPVFLLALLFNGFGEEIGWRGFALGPLQQRFGPLGGTLVLAALWVGWHGPTFAVVETYRAMSPAMIIVGFGLGLVSGAIVLARVSQATQGSVLSAALWHATYNMTAATAAGRGLITAVTSSCVMIWAGVLLLQERRPRAASRLLVPTEA